MGKGKPTDRLLKGQIIAHHENGKSYREIARQLRISKSTAQRVYDMHKNKNDNLPKSETRGRKRKTSAADDRLIAREASNSTLSAKRIRFDLGMQEQISKRTFIRRLNEVKHIKHEKIQRRPQLTKRHKNLRLEFCENHMSWDKEWLGVFFSDEKKFNLDGPDGWNYYWHDLRKDRIIQKRHHTGGGSVMVWVGITAGLKSNIVFPTVNINSKEFQKLLGKHVLKLRDHFDLLQMDNAKAHVSADTLDYCDEHDIQVMKWPPNSPDLNPVENLWGNLAREIFSNLTIAFPIFVMCNYLPFKESISWLPIPIPDKLAI
jgi:transposase